MSERDYGRNESKMYEFPLQTGKCIRYLWTARCKLFSISQHFKRRKLFGWKSCNWSSCQSSNSTTMYSQAKVLVLIFMSERILIASSGYYAFPFRSAIKRLRWPRVATYAQDGIKLTVNYSFFSSKNKTKRSPLFQPSDRCDTILLKIPTILHIIVAIK